MDKIITLSKLTRFTENLKPKTVKDVSLDNNNLEITYLNDRTKTISLDSGNTESSSCLLEEVQVTNPTPIYVGINLSVDVGSTGGGAFYHLGYCYFDGEQYVKETLKSSYISNIIGEPIEDKLTDKYTYCLAFYDKTTGEMVTAKAQDEYDENTGFTQIAFERYNAKLVDLVSYVGVNIVDNDFFDGIEELWNPRTDYTEYYPTPEELAEILEVFLKPSSYNSFNKRHIELYKGNDKTNPYTYVIDAFYTSPTSYLFFKPNSYSKGSIIYNYNYGVYITGREGKYLVDGCSSTAYYQTAKNVFDIDIKLKVNHTDDNYTMFTIDTTNVKNDNLTNVFGLGVIFKDSAYTFTYLRRKDENNSSNI